MTTSTGMPNFRLRRAAAGLVIGVVTVGLWGCGSALSPGYSRGGSEGYYESLLVRESARTLYGTGALDAGEVSGLGGGGKGWARVDSPGTTPSTQSARDRAAQIGIPSATLHMAEPVVNLSLQDAIARAVQHSLAIKVESYNPAIKESEVVKAMAGFDAVFFGNTQSAYNDDPQSVGTFANGLTWNNQAGIKRVLPMGTQIQASTSFNYRDIAVANGVTPPNPRNFWTTNENLQLVQPLLRGFGEDVNQASIYLAQRDHRISLAQFRQQVMTQLADVEQAYLTLVQAKTNVEVLERLVVASEQTYQDVLARDKIDATKASINQALSALESRRADLHDAQKVYRNASDAIKALINDPELDVTANVLVNPTDRPVAEGVNYDALTCIQTGLRQRPEMQQARLQLERADIILKVAKNDLLPKVNLTLALQNNGYARDVANGYGKTLDPAGFIDTTVGISWEVPIGNREADAAYSQRQNERRQAIENMMLAAQRVVQDIKQQLREVYSNFDAVEYRERVRVAAAEEFQGILDLENIRTRSPEFLQLKLDSQARLAQAEQLLTQTLINYNLAIMKLEQAKGTLLEYDRVSLDKAPPPAPPAKNDLEDLVRRPVRSVLAP